MSSKELFALFLRLVGVVGIIIILHHVLNLVPIWTPPSYLLILKWVIGVFACLYLMRGAPLLVKFAFPDDPGKAP